MKRKLFKKLHTITLAGAAGTALIATCPGTASSFNSHVTDTVIDNNDGTWTYNFTVFNDEYGNVGYGLEAVAVTPYGDPVIIDWELPYFDDMGIDSITEPEGWNHSIETIGSSNPATGWGGVAEWQQDGDYWKDHFDQVYGSPDNNPFNNNTKVLHWYVDPKCGTGCGIRPGGSMSGFSFTAIYPEGAAPYQTSWDTDDVFTGDPSFPQPGALPNSPSINPVPLPGSLALMLLGSSGLVIIRQKKKKKQ